VFGLDPKMEMLLKTQLKIGSPVNPKLIEDFYRDNKSALPVGASPKNVKWQYDRERTTVDLTLTCVAPVHYESTRRLGQVLVNVPVHMESVAESGRSHRREPHLSGVDTQVRVTEPVYREKSVTRWAKMHELRLSPAAARRWIAQRSEVKFGLDSLAIGREHLNSKGGGDHIGRVEFELHGSSR